MGSQKHGTWLNKWATVNAKESGVGLLSWMALIIKALHYAIKADIFEVKSNYKMFTFVKLGPVPPSGRRT